MKKNLLFFKATLGLIFFLVFSKLSVAQSKLYVNIAATGANNGSSWADAYIDLQIGINAAAVGDSVFVAQGIYQERLGYFPFEMKEGVKIYGSFQGTENFLTQRILNSTTDRSILKSYRGGVVQNDENGVTDAAVLDGFTITGGYGESGSGVFNKQSSPRLSNLIITGNSGGGIRNEFFSSPKLTNVVISGNSASSGAGIFNFFSSPILTNVTIIGNKAFAGGGGIFNFNSNPILINVTIAGNSSDAGGGIYNSNSNPNIKNSLLFGNTADNDDGVYNDNSTPIISNSLIQGVTDTNDGNISAGTYTAADIFTNPIATTNAPTTTGDYTLKAGSPAIDKGDNTSIPTGVNTDLAGNPRVNRTTVDLGAYEYVLPYKVFVTKVATGANNGISWANAFTNLQTGINAGQAGDSVFVAKGIYQQPEGVSFNMKEGVKIYGSFQGTEAFLSQRNIASPTDSSILKGNKFVSVVGNIQTVLTSASILDGFTITGGESTYLGGGISNFNASPTLNNLCIVGNTTTYSGGGIYNEDSSPIITNCTISGNYAKIGGGGILNNGTSSTKMANLVISGNTSDGGGAGIANSGTLTPTMDNLVITGNISGYWGGGIYDSSNSKMTNLIISGNQAYEGGGIYNKNSSSFLTNTIISGNTATNNGGGMFVSALKPTITNVTIVGNYAGVRGGGILSNLAAPIIKNSVIFGNTAPTNDGIGIVGRAIPNNTPVVSYSLVQGSTATTNGNISAGTYTATDIFTTPITGSTTPTTAGDYTLISGSPAINKGDNTDIPSDAKDLAGNPRIFEMTIDMGAYENQTATVLPVEFTSFTVKAKLNSALLKWQTASESNNKKFIISRSFNGTDFTEIGTVSGAGNSQNLNSYSFTDLNPAKGVNYYRLSQQDLNGTIIVLGMKALNFSLDKELLSVYPNPTEDVINIAFGANTYRNMFIINLNGQVLQAANINNEQSELKQNVATLPAGTYVILLKGAGAQSQIKFIKK